MLFYPKFYYKNVQSINLDELYKLGIRGIILDVDNTLIDYQRVMPSGIKEWVNDAKKRNFKVCILSNSNKKDKISKVAGDLKLEYLMSAKKPVKSGYIKALDLLNLSAEKCVAVGDQIFTDVIGANRMKINSIYVEPINTKEFWYTKWKRPIEAWILKRYKLAQNERK